MGRGKRGKKIMAFMDFVEKFLHGYSRKELNEYLVYAEQGDKNAQYQLGVIYSKGGLVNVNYETAIKWYTLAAEQEHTGALNNLGHKYLYGQGVSKDEKKAVSFFQKAAELGNPMAQYNLGNCYMEGMGVATDEKEAEVWFRKAAAQGHTDANNMVRMFDGLRTAENENRERERKEKEIYGFTSKDLIVDDVSTEGETSSKYMDYVRAVMSQAGYNAGRKRRRENSIREMELDPVMVEGLKRQDAMLAMDTSLHANVRTGQFFQQCGDLYINPKFITTTNIGVHMIKTSDVFAVSYEPVRSGNPNKIKYLLVFYTYNKLLPCFSTEIVVGIGTKQYDYFGEEGAEKYIPYLNLKYPIKPFANVRYHLRRDEGFFGLFKGDQLEDDIFPAIEWQRGMFEPDLYPCEAISHKEAIGMHFKRGYKPGKIILPVEDD